MRVWRENHETPPNHVIKSSVWFSLLGRLHKNTPAVGSSVIPGCCPSPLRHPKAKLSLPALHPSTTPHCFQRSAHVTQFFWLPLPNLPNPYPSPPTTITPPHCHVDDRFPGFALKSVAPHSSSTEYALKFMYRTKLLKGSPSN